MNLPPIETVYNGVRFRSRTEARWAVLLDRVGLTWLYEPEGFKTRCGWYVPDFWLPDIECFGEVKGFAEQWTANVLTRLQSLADQTGHPVLHMCDMRLDEWRLPCSWPGELDGFLDLGQSMQRGRPWWEPCRLMDEAMPDWHLEWEGWGAGVIAATTQRFDWKGPR